MDDVLSEADISLGGGGGEGFDRLTLQPDGVGSLEDSGESNLYTYISAVGSFVILLFASWCVGEGGEILGEKYDASIIGGLVIAWLNTAPEAIFFITALQDGRAEFAVGAVSGSTIVVCTIALGACLWFGSRARREKTLYLQAGVKKQCIILASSIFVAACLPLFGFNIVCAVLGITFYCWFLYYSLTSSQSTPSAHRDEDIEQGQAKNHSDSESDSDSEENEEDASLMKGVLYLIAGGLLILSFSGVFIASVVDLAEIMGVSPTLLAFFLAPIASEAPEILESIQLSRKGKIQNINIAFSNLVGGTITKTTLLMGIFSLYGVWKEFPWVSPNYSISIWLLIICAGVAAVIGGLPAKQTQTHGIILFVLFVACGIVQYSINSGTAEVAIQVAVA